MHTYSLVLAPPLIPLEGRLQQAALDLLAGCDIQFRRQDRLDIAHVKNHPIALLFLPASDIATRVAEGSVDLGITGSDQVREYEAVNPPTRETGAEKVLDLPFGCCKLQVQVPKVGVYQTPKDLFGARVTTSFPGLARLYFERLAEQVGTKGDDHGNMGMPLPPKITYQSGSVEASYRMGIADGIVDLVGMSTGFGKCSLTSRLWVIESGDTMRSAGLHAVGTVFESNAVLIRSRFPLKQELMGKITRRIKGVIAAQKYQMCAYNVPQNLLEKAISIAPGKRAPTVTSLDGSDWKAVSVMVEKVKIADVMDELAGCGAEDIVAIDLAKSI
ncbi:MAG: hypothetical protein Q9172_001684 [Xanthocarpia lactea]